MKIIFNTFIFYLLSFKVLFSSEYVANSTNILEVSKVINLPDGSVYSTLDTKGSGTNNFGNYEISNCAGHRLSKNNKLIEQDIYCNVELSNNHFYTFFMKRSETDTDAGVGFIIIAGGSKPFEAIKNKKCNYAVSFFKNIAYVKIKCDVDDDFIAEIKK